MYVGMCTYIYNYIINYNHIYIYICIYLHAIYTSVPTGFTDHPLHVQSWIPRYPSETSNLCLVGQVTVSPLKWQQLGLYL